MHSARRSLVRILGCDASLPVVAHAKWPVSLLMDQRIDLSLGKHGTLDISDSPFHLPKTLKRVHVALNADHYVNGGASFGLRKFVNHHFVRLQFHNPHILCNHYTFHEPPALAALAPSSISLEAIDGQTMTIYPPSFEQHLADWRRGMAQYKSWVASVRAGVHEFPDYHQIELPADIVESALLDDVEALEEDEADYTSTHLDGSSLQGSDLFPYLRAATRNQLPHDRYASELRLCDDLVKVGVVDIVAAWRFYCDAVARFRRKELTEGGVRDAMVAYRAVAIRKAGGVEAVAAAIDAYRKATVSNEPDIDENVLRGEPGSDTAAGEGVATKDESSYDAIDPSGNAVGGSSVDSIAELLFDLCENRTDVAGVPVDQSAETAAELIARSPRPPTRGELHRSVADCVLGSVLTAAAELNQRVPQDAIARLAADPPLIGGAGSGWVNWDADAKYVAESALRRRATITERAKRRFGVLVDANVHPTVSNAVRHDDNYIRR